LKKYKKVGKKRLRTEGSQHGSKSESWNQSHPTVVGIGISHFFSVISVLV